MISIHEDLPYNLDLLFSNHKHVGLPNILAYHGMRWGKVHWPFCDYSQGSLMNCMISNLKNYNIKNLENYHFMTKKKF
jgi:hypothetical protein